MPQSAPNSTVLQSASPVCPQISACRWRGLIETYRPLLPVSETTPVITLLEG
ncbi:MAG: threonine synthase, partial [Synechocystis sp.]